MLADVQVGIPRFNADRARMPQNSQRSLGGILCGSISVWVTEGNHASKSKREVDRRVSLFGGALGEFAGPNPLRPALGPYGFQLEQKQWGSYFQKVRVRGKEPSSAEKSSSLQGTSSHPLKKPSSFIPFQNQHGTC